MQKPEYAPLLQDTVAKFKGRPMDEIIDRLLVRFGCEILATVPGRVSTEVDARLSFDTEATIAKAKQLVALWQQLGIYASGFPVPRLPGRRQVTFCHYRGRNLGSLCLFKLPEQKARIR